MSAGRREHLQLTVNSVEHSCEVKPDTKLADLLRRRLGLTGTKIGCGEGQCGACTVLVDGRPRRSCSYPALRAAGKQVLTIEGLAASWGEPEELHPLQRAFITHAAVQCGFCSPGLLMSAAALWNKVVSSSPSEPVGVEEIKHALRANACRCTGYASVLRAIQSALQEFQTGRTLPPQELETLPALRVIGHSPPQPDVVAKITGAAIFTDDISFPGMLHGAVLRASHPHARVLSIDTKQAASLPGVHAVLIHKDVPGRNRHGLVYQDWPVLCGDKVRYIGDAVAIVAADTPEIASAARELIDVRYEPLPVVTTPEQARRPDAPLVHEDRDEGNLLSHIKVRHGDVEQGFAEADVVVDRTYHTPMYDHLFMEPECSIGVPSGYDADHAKLTVHVASQIPFDDRKQIAAALGLQPEEVRVIGPLMGGGFGGKEDIAGQIHAALLAHTTGRPVKVLYTRRESMLAHPKRHAMTIHIRTGAKKDGTLTAVQAELLGDAGAYASLSTKVLTRSTTHATGPYEVPNARIDCYAMYTNNPPAGAFRGFGVTQSAFAVEQNMDILAHKLRMDPVRLRRKNGFRVGSVTATGQVLRESVGLLDCLDWVADQVSSLSPVADTSGANVAWGLAVGYKNTGLGGGADDSAGAEIEVYADGTATVRSGSADMGQGLTTVVAQVAAEELGLPFGQLSVLLSDTDRTLDGGPTTASRQTFVTGNAARLASRAMRHRLATVAAARWDIPPDSIVFENGELRADGQRKCVPFSQAVQWLMADQLEPRLAYRYTAPETRPLGQGGDMHSAFSYGVQAAKVAVDKGTGEVRVLRLVTACDAGRAINPQAMLGQIEGGMIMGIGTALTEEYIIEGGIPKTLRFAQYKVPYIRDVPEMDVHIVEHLTAAGPYGAKGVGELPSIPTSPAICNAIYNAVGVRVQRLPVKPDWLLERMSKATREENRPEEGQ